jgi:cysteine desulfurase
MKHIYLDYNATTPIAPSVVDAMQPFLTHHFGNPSSSHSLGRAAAEAIEDARVQVAGLLGCAQDEVIFTSGGTESNNLAIKGVMMRGAVAGSGHLIISQIEHPAVSAPAKFLERLGYDVSVVPCDANGVVQPETVEAAIRPDTRLVSIMHANNEIGTIQPISKIVDVCHKYGVLCHTDAAQAVGKIPTMVDHMGVDMLTIAGHKLYGPKGVGALFVREGLDLEPALHGADHENGLRAGTENTPYIIGLGRACLYAGKAISESPQRMADLRDRLYDNLQAGISQPLKINGGAVERLPNTLSVVFPGVVAAEMLQRAEELCASTGSACHSSTASSVTLSAMNVPAEEIAGTMRLSVGWTTSQEEVDRASQMLIDAWEVLSQK